MLTTAPEEEDLSAAPEEPAAGPNTRAWLKRHARSLGLLLFVVLSFLWFAKTWVDPLHRHVGISGDPEAYMWALAWPSFAVAHHLNPFYSTYLLAPRGANLMWTIPPGFGLLLWPFTATIGLVLTYNLFATLSLAFSAWTAQLALRRFVPGELGPVVGGLFYGFSPYMAAHSFGHAMLTVAILPPLLLLLLHEALIRQRWRPALTGLAVGALLAFQISTFLEMLAGAAVAAALLVIVLALAYRSLIRERLRYFVITTVSAGASFLVLAGYQMRTLVFGARSLVHVHDHPHPTNVFVTDLLGFITPSSTNAFAPTALNGISRHFSTVGAEVNGYIGLPLLIIVIVIAVRHWSSATVRLTAVMTGIMAVLSMGPRLQIVGRSTIPLPWAVFEKLPLMGNLLPVRLSVFTDLGIALLLAYGIAHRARPATPKRNAVRAVAVVAVVITLAPSLNFLSHAYAPVEVPSYFTSSEVKKIPAGSIALIAPWTTDPSNVLPEYWQAASGFRFRLASGYAYVPLGKSGVSSGRLTDFLEYSMWVIGLGELPPDLGNKTLLREMRQDVKNHQISTIIIGPMTYQATMLRIFTYLLGRKPEHVGGVYVWYDIERTLPTP